MHVPINLGNSGGIYAVNNYMHVPVYVYYYAAGTRNIGVVKHGLSSLQGSEKAITQLAYRLVEASFFS